jgi:hypothetical protein
MRANKNSSRRRWDLKQDEHGFQNTSPTHYPIWPRPCSHWSATGPRNQQPPTPTLERSGTSNSSTTGLHRLTDESLLVDRAGPCWSNLAKPDNFHRKPLHRSGWCSSPIRQVQAKKSEIHQTNLPSSQLNQTRNSSNTRQHRTHQDIHPSKTQPRSAPVRPVRGTG